MSPAEPEPAELGADGAAAPLPPLAPVVMLRPIRTLVVARDLGFRQRAMTILGELGPVAFAVVSLDDVVALIEQQRADVVVLDATACASSIPRIVAALYDVNPRVGVVVISDGTPDHARRGVPALPKWGWATDISAAVMTAYRCGNPLLEGLRDASF
jgi:hypothetical protein